MTAIRLIWSFSRSAAAGMIVALVLAAVVPMAFGGKSFSVMSGSMEPNLSTGDLVLTKGISPSEAANGDIVTFNDPENKSRLLTHRVASSRVSGDRYSFVTKGDANNTVERWWVPADGKIGEVVFRLPKLGYVLSFTKTPAARMLLITLPALLLAAFGLASIWRTPKEERQDVAAAA